MASHTTNGVTWTYTYDADGLRTGRTDGTNTFEYINAGDKLVRLVKNGEVVDFGYAGGQLATMSYDGATYYYVLNGQGDVVALTDNTGKMIIGYHYSAYGFPTLLKTDSETYTDLKYLNPFMYRGYVFDIETLLYYLQSRYYDPEMGRFINADAFASTGQGILGNNMFAYCLNNPVNYIDAAGCKPKSLPFCLDFDDNEKTDKNVEENAQEDKVQIDLTEKLTEFMQANAAVLKDYYDEHGFIQAALYFYENVNDGGTLDIKLQDEWKFEDGNVYVFNGIELRYDDPGNINFGYVGAVIFSEEILCFGAGMNQISKWGLKYGNLDTFFDDPRDNEMIKLGYSLYWEDCK